VRPDGALIVFPIRQEPVAPRSIRAAADGAFDHDQGCFVVMGLGVSMAAIEGQTSVPDKAAGFSATLSPRQDPPTPR
jgi:hypothetical protein